ncbi:MULTISPECIES: LysR substrate-binding domain-containing protein [Pacificibacter]|uniref:LysR substrate-binding domain-containing protein n=1 Tax=Pacificibacter TaxID=1042323 RepID=UPI001C09324C|nr:MULTISPECIES: LysR substrate-binding domain-containing protein [Pacificibacter]MBU2937787.1 LysR family transcriptional regulator [Pacificibacter marinus]MDO6616048.1 LysR substrate-binding domain-containing protein [Pacificibacter sp. 1_MG-2023]
MNKNLNMDCIRSFVSIIEQGSFSKAALHVGRTAAAISLQMDRLQSQLGIQLFQKDGRNRVVTASGQEFFEHARAILAQNDAAIRLANSRDLKGAVRLGIVQDFADDFFPKALSSFSQQFKNIRINVIVERSENLIELLENSALDQVIAFRHTTDSKATLLRESEMIWLGKADTTIADITPLQLVLMDGPCQFRKAALKSLGDAGVAWDVKLASASMSCVSAAAEAGLGVAVRTADVLQSKKLNLSKITNLPDLPSINLQLYTQGEDHSPAIQKLSEYWIAQMGRPGPIAQL